MVKMVLIERMTLIESYAMTVKSILISYWTRISFYLSFVVLQQSGYMQPLQVAFSEPHTTIHDDVVTNGNFSTSTHTTHSNKYN